MGVNSLPKTVTRQRRGCDLNPDPSAPESSTLTTRLQSHPIGYYKTVIRFMTMKRQLMKNNPPWCVDDWCHAISFLGIED